MPHNLERHCVFRPDRDACESTVVAFERSLLNMHRSGKADAVTSAKENAATFIAANSHDVSCFYLGSPFVLANRWEPTHHGSHGRTVPIGSAKFPKTGFLESNVIPSGS